MQHQANLAASELYLGPSCLGFGVDYGMGKGCGTLKCFQWQFARVSHMYTWAGWRTSNTLVMHVSIEHAIR